MIRVGSITGVPVILFLLALACNKEEQLPRSHLTIPRQKYNVLLITLDTVRKDALQIYDSAGAPVPNLQQFAAHSIVFDQAITQIPYTLPSHASLFTSRYPIAHGVIDNVRGSLPENFPTLAESFRNQGYETAGFLGSLILERATKIDRGFNYYDDYFNKAALIGTGVERIERRAEEVVESFKHWFEQRNSAKNFFAFLHFYDAHAPYDPPSYFAPKSDDMKQRYYGEIRYVDYALGKLLEFLNQKAVAYNTVIVIEADHGEMFREHEEIGHGFYLYEPVLRVPLVVFIPTVETQSSIKIPAAVELIDIAPTLLDLTNIAAPESMQGRSLLPLLEDKSEEERSAYSESYLAALELGVSPLFAIRTNQFKYIDTAKPELYDLQNDPAEGRNLISEKQSDAADLKRQLSNYKQKFSASQQISRNVSAEEAEEFAALGYLGGALPQDQWNLKKDAKDYIEGWNQLFNIRLLIQRKNYGEALRLIERAKQDLPSKMKALEIHEADCYYGLKDYKKSEEILNSVDGEETILPLAQIYLKTGRKKKAVEVYRTSLDKKFEVHKLYNFVFLLKMADRNQEALKLVKELEHSNVNPDEARPYLAEMFYLLEDWDDMEKYGLQLVDSRPWELKWYLLLCDAYEEQKKLQPAVELMLKAESRFSNYPAYLSRTANLCQRTKQPQIAIKFYRRLVEIDPRDPSAYVDLAALLVDTKSSAEEAIQFAKQGLALSDDPQLEARGQTILARAERLKRSSSSYR